MLEAAHFIDDAFEDAAERAFGERAAVVGDVVAVYVFFALGLVDGKSGGFLGSADMFDGLGALVQEFDKLAVQSVDLLAVIGEQFLRLFGRHERIPSMSDSANVS